MNEDYVDQRICLETTLYRRLKTILEETIRSYEAIGIVKTDDECLAGLLERIERTSMQRRIVDLMIEQYWKKYDSVHYQSTTYTIATLPSSVIQAIHEYAARLHISDEECLHLLLLQILKEESSETSEEDVY